jgi:CRP/FNR family transcriptional regulator, cyclic AMP receptor protein
MQSFNSRIDTVAKVSPFKGQAFSNLTGKTLDAFNALGVEMDYSRGANLFLEGEAPQCVYIVYSGQIKLTVSSREGRTMILRIAHAGGVLGLSAALNGTDHEVTAEVIENCRVKAIRAKEFVTFLREHPEAAMEITRCLLQEYQVVFNDIRRLALPSTVAGRVANLLLEWLRPRPTGQNRLTVTLTHGEIAEMTGTSRESVSRAFTEFQKDKLIAVKGSSLTILRPEALEQMAV